MTDKISAKMTKDDTKCPYCQINAPAGMILGRYYATCHDCLESRRAARQASGKAKAAKLNASIRKAGAK